MPIESKLPENRMRRLEQSLLAAQNDVRRYSDAVWHLQSALARLSIDGPPELPINHRLCRPDQTTIGQIELALKVVRLGLLDAQRLEDSAAALIDAS